MVLCHYCNRKLDWLPRPCKFCRYYFCSKCFLPEKHECVGLEPYFSEEKKKFQSKMVDLASQHAKVHYKGYEDIVDVERKPFFSSKHKKLSHTKRHYYEVDEKYRREYVGRPSTHLYNKKNHKITFEQKQIFKVPMFLLVLIIFIIAILTLVILANINATEKIIEERKSFKTIEYNETVSNEITFKEYLENIYSIEGTEANIKGFLRRYVKYTDDKNNVGVYLEAIADDNNNTLQIISMNQELRKFFPKKGTSTEIYQIKVKFRRNYKTLLLDISDITLSQRDPIRVVKKERIVEYTENVTKEIKKPKFPLIRRVVFGTVGKEVICEDNTKLNNCSTNKTYFCSFSGLVRKPDLCGCPAGQRFYYSDCIPEVKCSDGTLEPDCSTYKPKQCVDGELIDNAELCGCPEDHKKIGRNCQKIFRCEDGTIYGECSKNKPYFCSAGALIKDSNLCGCDWGYKSYKGECIESNKAEAMEALDYLNKIRKQYGRSELKWDDGLHNLGIFRAKDMYERQYFDHVTPEGKCVKDFKADYGLAEYNIAENGGAVTYGSYDGKIDYASYADPMAQIDGWMESRGHRYNLLYPSHILGVVACYRGACVFLGANKEYYGLGFGPCTTGEEGLAYWQTVEKQQDEI